MIDNAKDIIDNYKKIKSENLDNKDMDLFFIHFDNLNKILFELMSIQKCQPKIQNDG